MRINFIKCVRKLPIFLKLKSGYSVEKHLLAENICIHLNKLKLSSDIDIYYSEKRKVSSSDIPL